MPIYEYQCRDCETSFEELVLAGQGPEKCPKCGSKRVQRQMSCFATARPTGSAGFTAAPSGGGCGSGGFS